MPKRRVFISYSNADKALVDRFCNRFSKVFTRRGLHLEEDIIDSNRVDYVMARIRRDHLQDSTVTIVLLGKCTWSRRFVDWEIQSSLRRYANGPPPNGLIGIKLTNDYTIRPYRLALNVESGYSKVIKKPTKNSELEKVIEWAFDRRRKSHLIQNPRKNYKYNRYNKNCPR